MPTQDAGNATDYWDILRRRRATVFMFFFLTVSAVAAGTYLMKPVYEATAVLLVDIESPNVVATGGVEMESQSTSYYGYREYYKSQMAIITSDPVMRRVFDEFKIGTLPEYQGSADPLKKFKNTVNVQSVRDTRLVKLSVENENPELAAQLANRICDLYIKHNLDYISKGEWLNLLKNEYLRLETKLAEYSKIYKEGHPEMIRLREEMSGVVKNIAKEKGAGKPEAEEGASVKGPFRGALAGLKANNVSVMEYAQIPVEPAKPKKLFNLLMAVFIGLFGGAGLAFCFEYQDVTVKDIEDVERLVSWVFVGKVPHFHGSRKEAHVHTAPDDHVTEAFKSIRTQVLLLDKKDRPLKTIALSSIGPEEGKTLIICNLAIALAQSQKRVLLVDADMRRPRVHEIFKKKDIDGLCAFLAQDAGYEDFIHRTEIENLFYMADGRSCANSTELLSAEKMKDFVAAAREDFDVILFDTPPVGIVSDAVLLATMVDGVILVVESGKTPKKALVRHAHLLKNSNIKFAGFILNNVGISERENYYYAKSYTHSK